ncbi:MAG TPA: dihydrolipoamide acetyltransferase family protein [Tepidisphaeraceae bacterium]|jgi:pyruvate dehydrogenase E2 component (dihydrolipoamide acetyltransferase)|nr:dihydrolipoamide acetyltransferase family protein [Tepidisphaeraceae bacterium]
MPSEITMPQLSDTMTEGTLVKWKKKEGDKVASGEEIAEVETDKATMPMEAFDAGTLAVMAIAEGGKVPVGGLVGVIALAGEKVDEVKKKYAGGGTAKPQEAKTPVIEKVADQQSYVVASHGEIHETGADMHNASRGTEQEVAAATAVVDAPVVHHGNGGGRVFVSPLARRIAEDKKIDLGQLKGTGPGGRIVQKDVLAYTPADNGGAKVAAAQPLAAPMTSGQKTVIAMTKMRVAIATALQRSKQNVPHFYESIDIDVEDLSKLRERLNAKLEKEKVRLSIADFISKGVAAALLRHPVLNSRFDASKNEVTQYGDVNLGLAVSIPDGLIVPVLRGVQGMGLKEIRQRSVDLYDRARAQRLKREEQSEATFTISSLGSFGIREFSAIINPPEVGILAVGAAEKRAVVRGDAIVARTMMTVTLSCDHRVVDGATAADFLKTLKEILEEPAMLLV